MNIKVSVIVPVFEQWHYVPALLERMARQSLPVGEFEVVLVDNGSSKIVIPEKMADNVRVLHCETPGAYAARNHGIQNSSADWVVFTDADCLPEKDWLAEVLAAVHRVSDENCFFAGAVVAVGESDQPNIYEIYDIVRGIPQAHYVSRGYAATANLALPRKLAESLNGFNGKLYSGGDADLCKRASRAGYQLMYLSSAKVLHRARTTWCSIASKARRVKGGQLTCKSFSYRVWILFRTLVSPGISFLRYGRKTEFPIRFRVIAMIIYLRVWIVEITELIRLAFGSQPERR